MEFCVGASLRTLLFEMGILLLQSMAAENTAETVAASSINRDLANKTLAVGSQVTEFSLPRVSGLYLEHSSYNEPIYLAFTDSAPPCSTA